MTGVKKIMKLDSLTSLRFFAAALIVALHSTNLSGMGSIEKYIPAAQGVSFFFVLSGFILAYAYPAFTSRESIERFYVARIARIWPLHLLTLIIWIVLIDDFSLAKFEYADGIVRFFANILMIHAWVPIEIWQTSFNGVSWSISAEIFFYILFPIIIVNFQKYWKEIIALQLTLIASIILLSSGMDQSDSRHPSLSSMLYFFPPARLLEFTIGIFIHAAFKFWSLRRITLTSLQWTAIEISSVFLVCATMYASSNHQILYALNNSVKYFISVSGSAISFAIMIFVFSTSKGFVNVALSYKPLIILGESSFALYLIHYPLIAWMGKHEDLFRPGLITYAIMWALAIFLSTLLHYFIESPIRKIILSAYKKNQNAIKYNCFKSSWFVATIILVVPTLAVTSFTAYKQIYPSYLINSTNEITGIANFDNNLTINSLKLFPESEDYIFLVLAKFPENDNQSLRIGIHANDATGKILFNLGSYSLESFTQNKKNKSLYEAKIIVKRKDIAEAKTFGIVSYAEPNELSSSQSEYKDWGGKRAIFMIKDQ